jgi:hypothetical protein
VTIPLKAGERIEYKFIRTKEDGSAKWESDPNHTYRVPASCATKVAKYDEWQS